MRGRVSFGRPLLAKISRVEKEFLIHFDRFFLDTLLQ